MSVNECLKAIVLCLRIDSIKTQALVIKVRHPFFETHLLAMFIKQYICQLMILKGLCF